LAAAGPVTHYCQMFGALRNIVALATLGILGAIVYGGAVAVISGRGWWREFTRRRRGA
jgi:hypothetical protein